MHFSHGNDVTNGDEVSREASSRESWGKKAKQEKKEESKCPAFLDQK